MSLANLRRKPRVLFLGQTNRCRTQMAEAYMQKLGAPYLDVQSAGLSSGVLDRRMLRVMEEDGIDLKRARAMLADAELLTWADLIIVIAGEDEHIHAPIPSSAVEKIWTVANPQARALDDIDLVPYREARDQIKRRVTQLVNSVRLFKC